MFAMVVVDLVYGWWFYLVCFGFASVFDCCLAELVFGVV